MQKRGIDEDFDYKVIPITTITAMGRLNITLSLEEVYNMMTLTDYTKMEHDRKKLYIKHSPENKGQIYGVSREHQKYVYYRGMKVNPFKHSVTLLMCTSTNISTIKIIVSGCHMAGPKSIESTEEVVDIIIRHIVHYRSFLSTVSDNPRIYNKVVKWFDQNLKGEIVPKVGKRVFIDGVELPIRKDMIGNLMIHDVPVPDEIPKVKEKYQKIARDIIDFLLLYAWESKYYDDFRMKVCAIKLFSDRCDSFTGILKCSIEYYMINKIFDIGYRINENNLPLVYNNNDGFSCNYTPGDHQAVVAYPYRVLDKKGEYVIKKQSFMVRSTGKVTHSGNELVFMEKIAMLFITIARTNRPILEEKETKYNKIKPKDESVKKVKKGRPKKEDVDIMKKKKPKKIYIINDDDDFTSNKEKSEEKSV